MFSLKHETHPLLQQFTFWVTYFKKSKDKQLEEFEDNLKPITNLDTVEDFWSLYERMKRPSLLPRGCEFLYFKTGIKPLWEDPSNLNGGRFYVSLKKSQLTNRIWEDLLIGLMLASSEFSKLNGVILNVRQSEIFISIWTKQLDMEENQLYREWIRKTLEFPNEQSIEYKQHPNNQQLIQKQEQLTKEENERIKKESEFEKKKAEDFEKRRTKSAQSSLFGKTTQKEAEQLAKLINEIEEDEV